MSKKLKEIKQLPLRYFSLFKFQTYIYKSDNNKTSVEMFTESFPTP